MNIDAMEAGREMDALVARQVMGWPEQDCHPGALAWAGWSPSTDIDSAWDVVEKMIEKHRVDLHGLRGGKDWRCWVAGFDHADAPTAPLAICRAALKAVGV